jgi:ribonuclease HI
VKYILYTDGSAHRMASAWAFVVITEDNQKVHSVRGGCKRVLSNVAEMAAIRHGLDYIIASLKCTELVIRTDDKFLAACLLSRQPPKYGSQHWSRILGSLAKLDNVTVECIGGQKTLKRHQPWHTMCHKLAFDYGYYLSRQRLGRLK